MISSYCTLDFLTSDLACVVNCCSSVHVLCVFLSVNVQNCAHKLYVLVYHQDKVLSTKSCLGCTLCSTHFFTSILHWHYGFLKPNTETLFDTEQSSDSWKLWRQKNPIFNHEIFTAVKMLQCWNADSTEKQEVVNSFLHTICSCHLLFESNIAKLLHNTWKIQPHG